MSKKMIGFMALAFAGRNAPPEIAAIARREDARQFSGLCLGLNQGEPPELKRLRAWLRANPPDWYKAAKKKSVKAGS